MIRYHVNFRTTNMIILRDDEAEEGTVGSRDTVGTSYDIEKRKNRIED